MFHIFIPILTRVVFTRVCLVIHTNYPRSGIVLKQHSHTSGFSRRFLEIHGGVLSWTKLSDMKKNANVSVRRLAGGVVVPINSSNKLVNVQPNMFMFEVFLAYDTRKVHVTPLIFAAESEADRALWIRKITIGSNWMYHPSLLRPLSNRLCGLVVMEIIIIENVLVADWSGKSDPYVVIEADNVLARTPTHYETLTATYSHMVTIPILNDDPNLPITLMVFDEDALKKDDMLGGVSMPLHSLGFNKEIVWDSIPLKRFPGTVAAKQSFGGDPFGAITFRTIYKSSKLTQLLPVNQPRHIIEGPDESLIPKISVDPVLELPVSPMSTSGKSDTPSTPTPSSPPTSPTSPSATNSVPSSSSANAFDYDFSIEIFKLQLSRIGAILATLKIFSGISYMLQFRDPFWSITIIGWFTWILLIEPGSALMFWYALLAKLMLQAHPNYLDFVHEIHEKKNQIFFFSHFSNFKNLFARKLLAPSVTMPLNQELLSSTGSADFENVEYRVFECQRRKIANAFTMISTMVKVPANVAVAAGTAALRQESADEEITALNTARSDLGNLFKHFSSQNLNANETEWVSITGVPLEQSPSTIIAGTKIKWGVSIKSTNDPAGWEYAKSFPPLLTSIVGNAIDYDSSVPIWNKEGFVKNLKLHRHWVRRRMWIGKPIRPALEAEEPIRLSQIVEATIDTSEDTDLKKNSSSIFAKFRLIMTEGKKLQGILFSVSSQLESFKNLVSWKARWISSVIFVVMIILLVASIFVPQRILCWIITMLIVLDSYTDMKVKRVKTAPLLHEVIHQVSISQIPDQWKEILRVKLESVFSKMHEITNEVSVQVLAPIVQKALLVVIPDAHHVVLVPSDFGEGVVHDGGPLTWGHVLENIYLKANRNNADWWKSRKTSIHPKNLIKGHLVADWEEFNPTSLFAKK